MTIHRSFRVPSPFALRLSTIVLLAAVLVPAPTRAQEHRLLALDHPAYVYVQRLQRGGHLLALHPTALPYTEGAVRRALDGLDPDALSATERRWADVLERMLGPARPEGGTLAGVRLEGGLLLSNAERPEPLRPLGDTLTAWPRGTLQGYLEHGPWIAHLGIRHDLAYRYHPDALDAARRLVVRSDDAYLRYERRYAALFAGRTQRHWGAYGAPAVLLSDNAFAFDHLALRLGGERLALRSLVGELDALGPDGRFTGEGFAAGSTRRYLAAHRVDWRPSPRLALTVMESVVYSAPGAGLSLRYASPVHTLAFVVANQPRNEEDNGLIAGMLWAHVGGLTLHGQALLDDFDVVNGVEPASAAFAGQAVYRLPGRPVDLAVEAALATARAYNAHQQEGDYVYLRQGLALAHSDFVRLAARADLYLDAHLPGLALAPHVEVLWQGEADPLDPFPPDHDAVGTLLDGTPERTVRPALALFYQPHPALWLRADAGWNVSADADHVSGRRTTRFVGLLQFGFRLDLDRPVRLSF